MIRVTHWRYCLSGSLVVSLLLIAGSTTATSSITLVNSITIPGETKDLYPLNGGKGGANVNRLGGFGSDLFYNPAQKVYYGLVDRGPGGGTIGYDTRVQKFSLSVNPTTGVISNFKLLATIGLKQKDGTPFNGFSPERDNLNGNPENLGRSLDPEGFVVAPNGNFYISDEYGPSLLEFQPNGKLVRRFQIPQNVLPIDSNNKPNYSTASSVKIVKGRQLNRGFEGLAISPDGKKLYALLQDPLAEEGQPNGTYSRNLRLVIFDTKKGSSTAQYIYSLESLSSINSRIEKSEDAFKPDQQGRSIGISAIAALNEHEFLVLERDNRGFGVEDPTSKKPVASKRLYKIDLRGATDVSRLSLKGTNTLPTNVKPVKKSSSPFLDIAKALKDVQNKVPEKFEGLTFGPKLADGSYALILATDNDFSVTQEDSGQQSDVCTDGKNSKKVPIDSSCPAGQKLIPSYLFSFKAK
ncbi:MAG TPA: esterase-like activity of phytase family protein [Coleofasciculaceae cyanobacterium]|jgi:hypothetical protein